MNSKTKGGNGEKGRSSVGGAGRTLSDGTPERSGLFSRFLAWLSRGAAESYKDGASCPS